MSPGHTPNNALSRVVNANSPYVNKNQLHIWTRLLSMWMRVNNKGLSYSYIVLICRFSFISPDKTWIRSKESYNEPESPKKYQKPVHTIFFEVGKKKKKKGQRQMNVRISIPLETRQ